MATVEAMRELERRSAYRWANRSTNTVGSTRDRAEILRRLRAAWQRRHEFEVTISDDLIVAAVWRKSDWEGWAWFCERELCLGRIA